MSKAEADKAMLDEDCYENSLSVNTSDADGIQSEYYFDEAIDKKVSNMNKNFEDRVKLMTNVIVDRIEESSSSDEYQNYNKASLRKHIKLDKIGDQGNSSLAMSNKRKYHEAFRKKRERSHTHKRHKHEDEGEVQISHMDSIHKARNFYSQQFGYDGSSLKKRDHRMLALLSK